METVRTTQFDGSPEKFDDFMIQIRLVMQSENIQHVYDEKYDHLLASMKYEKAGEMKTEDIKEHAERKFKKDNDYAWNLVYSLLKKNVDRHVWRAGQPASPRNFPKALEKLEKKYEVLKAVKLRILEQEYAALRPYSHSSEDLLEYAYASQRLIDEMNNMGGGISDEQAMSKFLATLPDQYSFFLFHMQTASDATYDKMIGLFTGLMKGKQPETRVDVAKMITSNNTVKCYECSKEGHKRPNCPERTNLPKRQSSNDHRNNGRGRGGHGKREKQQGGVVKGHYVASMRTKEISTLL